MFTISEYWALCRVGEARVGFDTLVDRGCRTFPMVLGERPLGISHAPWVPPAGRTDRFLTGVDRPKASLPLTTDINH
jgi:hypothetical protein